MSINLTDEIDVKTKKGKLGAAKQIFLEGDTQTVEKEIQDINSRHNDLSSKHESLSSTVSEHTNQIESNQSQITANKSAQDEKNTSLEENMKKLNTRDDQITESLKGITASGGASVATAVTYDNTSSQLVSATVQGAVDELSHLVTSLKSEFSYKGIAKPTTNPGVPDNNVFYIAGEGLYPNFDNQVVEVGQIAVLKWDGSWHKEVLEIGAGGGNMILDWNTDLATTRKQVLQKYRKPGIQISYNDPNRGWINEQYIGTSIQDVNWVKDSNWVGINHSNDINSIKNFNDRISLKGKLIKGYYNRFLNGQLTLEVDSFNCTIKIPCFVGRSFTMYKGNEEYKPFIWYIWKNDGSFINKEDTSTIVLEDDDKEFACNINVSDINEDIWLKCNDNDLKKYPISKIIVSNKNLFNISDILDGYFVNKVSGVINKNAESFPNAITSGRIPISAGATYTISGRFDTDGAVGYDVNGNKVKIFPSDDYYKLPVINGTFTIPTDSEAVEMQITCRLNDGNDISQLQVEEGNKATEFEPYREVGIGTKLAEIDNRIIRLENLNKIIEYTSDNFDTSDNGIWYQSLSPSIGNKVIKDTNGNAVSLIGLKIPTKKGDTWLLNLLGGAGTGRGYFVTDINNTILELAESSFNCLNESYKLEINYDNAAYLYVNCQKGTTDNREAFKVLLLNTKFEIEELDKRISALEQNINNITKKRTFKFLLIGSSFGVNTIIQFPFLAKSAGIEITCGNLFKGGVTLEGIKNIIDGSGNFETGRIFKPRNGRWENYSSSFEDMLTNYDWDVISLQRSADDRTKWDETQINNLEYIINYIRSKTSSYNPKIVFNTIFSTPVNNSDKSEQIQNTKDIISTALKMQDDFGLEIIPTCTAVQNARNTKLIKYGFYENAIPDLSFDNMHLDFGVGSYITGALLFEYFLGKRFNMSVLNVSYIPTEEDINSINIPSLVWPGMSYTQPTEEFTKIAKYCAMAACRKPYEVNTALGVRFPYVIE